MTDSENVQEWSTCLLKTDFNWANQFREEQENLIYYDPKKQICRKLSNLPKAKQVYFNTLAVEIAHKCCECVRIDSNLEASRSWDCEWRTRKNVADLVTKFGRIECLPLLPDEPLCNLQRKEVLKDHIGYMVVRLYEKDKKATIEGFIRILESHSLLEPVMIEEIYPLSEFISLRNRLIFTIDFLRGHHPIAEEIQPYLKNRPILEIAILLERIYSSYGKTSDKLLYAAEKVLSGSVEEASVTRNGNEDINVELFMLVELLMEYLKENWE